MTEPRDFFTKSTLVKTECDACGLVRCISVDSSVSVVDMRRLKPHMLAAMNWIALPDAELSCESCSEMLQSTMMYLPKAKALTVQNALFARLTNGRIQVLE